MKLKITQTVNQLHRAVFAIAVFALAACAETVATPSTEPATPFKLATYAGVENDRLALVVDGNLIDLERANAHLVRTFELGELKLPTDMRSLIEQYDVVKNRLYQIANHVGEQQDIEGTVGRIDEVTLRAPIRYPYNLLAVAANYSDHLAELMRGRDFVVDIDPDRDDPYLFAKSARSSINDPGAPFVMPAGREEIDWEVELAIVIGKHAKDLTLENAHDFVFGYSIIHDISDREPRYRKRPAFDVDWFSTKSRDAAAPFGPVIAPAEFLPDHDNLRLITRVNGTVKQDGNSKNMIFDEAHLLRFITSIMTLYPGDVIATGTPAGVGRAKQPAEYLKAGDVVEVEIEKIGKLTTPIIAPEN